MTGQFDFFNEIIVDNFAEWCNDTITTMAELERVVAV